ncbi:MAG: ABC transporter permease [Xenophilus sp.]
MAAVFSLTSSNSLKSSSVPGRRRLPAAALVPLLALALLAAMAVVEPRFYSRLNLVNIGRNAALASLLALGQMLVMIVGGFDMSLGAVVALGSVVGASTMAATFAAWPGQEVAAVAVGIGAALVSGAAVGIVNGLLVSGLRVAPFMSTLAVGSSVTGLVFYTTKGSPIHGFPASFADVFGRGIWLGLPVPVWLALAVLVLMVVLMTQRPFGRHLLAVGGNPAAARASGIAAGRLQVAAYAAAGLLAALAGVLLTARIGSGQATLGGSAAIESIAACVIGGVSLRGGVGSPWRVVSAAIFVALIGNAMNLARLDSKWQTAVLGAALLLAVGMEVRAQGRRKESGNV